MALVWQAKEETGDSGEDAATASSTAYKELQKWVDTSEAQYTVLHAKHEALAGRFATAVR